MSGRLVAALLVVVSIAWTGAPAAAARGGPPGLGPLPRTEPNGWQPVFASDFSGGTVPRQCTPFDGPPAGQAASYFRPDEVQVSGGMLRLSIRRRDFAERPYTAGGLGCYQVSQLYGRYEYRARVAPGAGLDSYLAFWPETGGRGGAGGGPEDTTVVEVSSGQGEPEAVRLSNAYGTGEVTRKEAAGRYTDDFHVYLVEWGPTGLRVSVDGQSKLVDSRVSAKRRWFGFALGTGDEDTGLPAQRDLPAEFLVDWVRVYRYAPGTGGSVPAPTPTGRTASPSGEPRVSPAVDDRPTWPTAAAAAVVVAVLLAVGAYGVLGRSRRGHSAHRA